MDSTPLQDVSGLNVRGLNSLILALHRAGREAAYTRFQSWVLEEIKALIPFDSAWWGNASAETQEIHRLHLHNCDDSILQAYPPYMDQDFFRAALIASPGVTINMADLTTHSHFVRTELYRKVGKRYRIEWSLGTLLVEPVSSLYEFLTLWRHHPEKPFTETERQVKELLMPHLAEAHRTSRLREVLGETREITTCWAVTDERGFLREVSPGLVHYLRDGWPTWEGSRLPQPLLESTRLGKTYHSGKLKIEISIKGEFRYLQVAPTSALDKLSSRELNIATRFAHGDTYTEISAALSIAPATVRNHIASCYRKLSVNNKAELLQRILLTTSTD